MVNWRVEKIKSEQIWRFPFGSNIIYTVVQPFYDGCCFFPAHLSYNHQPQPSLLRLDPSEVAHVHCSLLLKDIHAALMQTKMGKKADIDVIAMV